MTFNQHPITTALQPYIEAIFHFKGFMPDHSIERVVPTGHIFLIFELDGFPRNTFDNESLEPLATFTQVWVSGMHRNYISISAHQKSEMLVVQFKAHGAYPFFHFPIHQLNEKVTPAEVFFGKEILALRNHILAKPTSATKFMEVENWLINRFEPTKVPPKILEKVLVALQQAPASQFSEIIANYPKTQKHLISQFKKYVGLTPKYYQRILRFNEILQKIHLKEKIAWSQIAYSCGYADQAHFIKEFNHFSGFNPTTFIQQDLNQAPPNFFPIDKKG